MWHRVLSHGSAHPQIYTIGLILFLKEVINRAANTDCCVFSTIFQPQYTILHHQIVKQLKGGGGVKLKDRQHLELHFTSYLAES